MSVPEPTPGFDAERWFQRYAGLVRRRVCRFYEDVEADDITQEIFASLIANPPTLAPNVAPSTWLYRVATNHCLNRLRDQARRIDLLALHGRDVHQPSTNHDPDAKLFIESLWQTLPDEVAQAGVYFHVDGMSQSEIAEVMGVTRRTVYNWLRNLRTSVTPPHGLRAHPQATDHA